MNNAKLCEFSSTRVRWLVDWCLVTGGLLTCALSTGKLLTCVLSTGELCTQSDRKKKVVVQ